jgi:uncharacterized membrane protein
VPRVTALVVLRALTLVALAATAALVIEYRTMDSAFCGAESGCAELRHTELAYLWGIGVTLPELGAAGLLLVYVLSLTRARIFAAIFAVLGGVAAVGLVALQAFVWHRYCWLCLTVDASSVLAAGVAIYWLAWQPPLAEERLPTWAWVLLGLLALAAPIGWPLARPLPDVPSSIRAYYVPNKINVVEFADFQCPHCRNLHPRLKALLARYGARVHFVRLNMPLGSHPHAHGAALAMLCAEPDKAEAFADFLFTTEDLSSASLARGATELGMNGPAFEACRGAASTNARLEREVRLVRDTGLLGLPTTYVGGRRIVGAQSDDMFRAALDAAENHEGEHGLPGWLYLTLALGAFGLIVGAGARAKTRARLPHGEFK